MFSKRVRSPKVTIILLAACLVASGCATAPSQAAKPHKPQMITSNGPEEVGDSNLGKGFGLSDEWAGFLTAMEPVFKVLGSFANH